MNIGYAVDLLATHLGSTTMSDIEIGFVSNLKAEDSIAENLLTSLDDIQTPISGIIKWNTLRTRISASRVSKNCLGFEPTKEPVDVDQRANVRHHVQDLRGVYQRWCLCL